MEPLSIGNLLDNGWPALLLMAICVAVLAFLRLVVPRLIEKWQSKRPLSNDDLKK